MPGTLSLTRRNFWFEVFYLFIMALGDTQLVTSLAMIITGFVRMDKWELSTYHWIIVQDLVWVGLNSHFLTVSVIETWISEKREQYARVVAKLGKSPTVRRPYAWLRTSRFLLMTVMFACLLTMIVFSAGIDEYWNCPARCTVSTYPGSTHAMSWKMLSVKWMVANILLVLFAYASLVTRLVEPLSDGLDALKDGIRKRFKPKLGNVTLKRLSWLLDFFRSILFQTLLTCVWFVLGVYWLITDWQFGQKMLAKPDEIDDYLQCDADAQGEHSWRFGQIVPLLLLLLPTLALVGAYEDETEAEKFAKAEQLESTMSSSTSGMELEESTEPEPSALRARTSWKASS